MSNSIIAIIPARRGSVGVPFKNIRLLGSKPLVTWTIEAAIESSLINKIIVTSNDETVLSIASDYNLISCHRPEAISQNNSNVIDAIHHSFSSSFQTYASDLSVVLLQPTTPFRSAEDIDNCIKLHLASGASVCSVVQVEDHHPARMYSIDSRGFLNPYNIELECVRRQDLPPCYLRNGAIYIARYLPNSDFNLVSKPLLPYIMPPERSINIDSQIDFLFAEFMVDRRLC